MFSLRESMFLHFCDSVLDGFVLSGFRAAGRSGGVALRAAYGRVQGFALSWGAFGTLGAQTL